MGVVARQRTIVKPIPLSLAEISSSSVTWLSAGSILLDLAAIRDSDPNAVFTWRSSARLDAFVLGLTGSVRLYNVTAAAVIDSYAIAGTTNLAAARVVTLPTTGIVELQVQVARTAGLTGTAVLHCSSLDVSRSA